MVTWVRLKHPPTSLSSVCRLSLFLLYCLTFLWASQIDTDEFKLQSSWAYCTRCDFSNVSNKFQAMWEWITKLTTQCLSRNEQFRPLELRTMSANSVQVGSPYSPFFPFLPHKSSDNFMTFLSLRKKHGRGACMLLPQGSQPKLHLFSPHPEPYFSSLDVHDVFVQTERGKQIPTLGESIHASATTVQHWYCMSSDHIFWHVRNSSSHPLKTPRQTVHIYCRPKLLSAQIKMSCTTHSLFKSYSATLTLVSSLTDAKAHICMKCRAAWLCEWDRTETMW